MEPGGTCRRLVGLVLLTVVAACGATQRYPQPMGGPDDLPPGVSDLFPVGPEQAIVVRHGDTVHVKRAGQDSIFPLRYFDKQVRVNAGAAVLSDASGRAEVVFPRDSRVVLLGRNVIVLGSPSRGEPLVYVASVQILELTLGAGEYAVLPGGTQLSGPGGPFVLEQGGDEILILRNRAAEIATVRFRESTFELNPGEVVHLPQLEVGSAPLAVDPELQNLPVGDGEASLWGDVEIVEHDGRRLVVEAGVDPATEPHEVRAFGVRVRLNANEQMALDGLDPNPPPVIQEAFGGPSVDGGAAPADDGGAPSGSGGS